MITFEVPELLKKVFSFEAGEYLTLQQTINGQKVRRAYSICSGVNEGELSVAVKRVPNGLFSTYATTQLKAGDVLEVMPPMGSFVFFYDIFGNRDIMLFSAGSGVTPMMSIAKTALAKTNIKVVFVYGNKSKEETLFFDEIEAALDEKNTKKIVELLHQFINKSQFILITHNKETMKGSHRLYGVTMNKEIGETKIVSVDV